MNAKRLASAVVATVLLAGCNTKHEIVVNQPKPMEVNVNLSGRLEVVVTDARKDLEQIEGEKPKRIVTPEDIGLPASVVGPPAPATRPGARGVVRMELPVYLSVTPLASGEELKESMRKRREEVRELRRKRLVGEAHTGLLVEKRSLSAGQRVTVAAENKDRSALYEQEAKEKGKPVTDVALGYYIARLSYVEKGSWVEKFNKDKGAWEWVEWQG